MKYLKKGVTTGYCSAAAAKAAALWLLGRQAPPFVKVLTPVGMGPDVEITYKCRLDRNAECTVKKFAGDDPDVTDGIILCAAVELAAEGGIVVDGGRGVGRVTKKGLDQPVGAAAINTVPRQMIERELAAICQQYGYEGGLQVTISVPEGERIAVKTFNPRLGIEGGISILGTTGIVEPMSQKALLDSIYLEMKVKREMGQSILLCTPGNYGQSFLQQWQGQLSKAVLVSNYIGSSLEFALDLGFTHMVLVSHLGKLVKVAGGVMNTHSRQADCRMEILCAHSGILGASQTVLKRIMGAVTVEEALQWLPKETLRSPVIQSVLHAAKQKMELYVGGKLQVEAATFTNAFGLLGETSEVTRLFHALEKADPQ